MEKGVFTSPYYLTVMLTKPLAESIQQRRRLARIHYQIDSTRPDWDDDRDRLTSLLCHRHLRLDYVYTT